MKIEVTEEGRKDIYIPEKDSLIKFIKNMDTDYIHNYLSSSGGSMMLGCDYTRKQVVKDIKQAERMAILLGENRKHNLGHALSLIVDNRLSMFDIGEITEDDLEIKNPPSIA